MTVTSAGDPLITVYLPCHNYEPFVGDAIESVLRQTYQSWELILVDDGSTDQSFQAMDRYRNDERVRLIRNPSSLGLRRVANQCIDMARGSYIIRLDADDMLHPRCLELLLSAAVEDPEADLVFSDFYYVDDLGEVIGVELLRTLEHGHYEANTFPPHGACSLIRINLMRQFGSYSEDVLRQDGHELWLKLLSASASYKHVSLPLFFYRKHGTSMSSGLQQLLEDRASIKRRLAGALDVREQVVAVIPIKNTYEDMPDLPFRTYNGERLIDLAIKAAMELKQVSDVLVTTDSAKVARYVADINAGIKILERGPELSRPSVNMVHILKDVVSRAQLAPETVICLLNANCPRRRSVHVQKALDTFFLYRPDSVVTVYEEQNLMYQMGESGLRPINASYQYSLRREREVVYVDTGAVRVFPVRNLDSSRYLGDRIGHALMMREDAFQVTAPQDLKLLDPYENAEAVTLEA